MPPLTVSVCGSIGAGKSTLLNQLQATYPLIEEGVKDWVDDGGFNWLQAFYDEPTRWTFSFQMRVLQTLDESRARMLALPVPVVLTERCPLDSRHVFFEYHREKQWVTPAEYRLYDYHWQRIAWQPDVIIFIQADPETCHRRAQERGRAEESALELSFFQDMGRHYEQLPARIGKIPIYVCDNNTDGNLAGKTAAITEFIEQHRQRV